MPVHDNQDLKPGTQRSIMRDTGLTDAELQIDHIVAEKHHGQTVADNLALCCLNDNLHKGPNIAGLDPETGTLTRLFHPRRDLTFPYYYRRDDYPSGRSSGRFLVGKHCGGDIVQPSQAANCSAMAAVSCSRAPGATTAMVS